MTALARRGLIAHADLETDGVDTSLAAVSARREHWQSPLRSANSRAHVPAWAASLSGLPDWAAARSKLSRVAVAGELALERCRLTADLLPARLHAAGRLRFPKTHPRLTAARSTSLSRVAFLSPHRGPTRPC
jgi:hypothetical protein